jgi:uncharacterized RDD family membrane protein YckC
LADWWQRVGDALIDGLIVGLPGAVLIGVVVSATSKTAVEPFTGTTTTQANAGAFWAAQLLFIAAALLYFGILDGRGQTVGKQAVGIAVSGDRTGYPIGTGRAMTRRLLYIVLWYVLFIPGLLNALSPLWDPKRQAWHDHAVGSVVIKVR